MTELYIYIFLYLKNIKKLSKILLIRDSSSFCRERFVDLFRAL